MIFFSKLITFFCREFTICSSRMWLVALWKGNINARCFRRIAMSNSWPNGPKSSFSVSFAFLLSHPIDFWNFEISIGVVFAYYSWSEILRIALKLDNVNFVFKFQEPIRWIVYSTWLCVLSVEKVTNSVRNSGKAARFVTRLLLIPFARREMRWTIRLRQKKCRDVECGVNGVREVIEKEWRNEGLQRGETKQIKLKAKEEADFEEDALILNHTSTKQRLTLWLVFGRGTVCYSWRTIVMWCVIIRQEIEAVTLDWR